MNSSANACNDSRTPVRRNKWWHKGIWPETVRQARRLVVAVVGATVLLCGVVMLVTPGPGLLVIVAGLGVLAIEFAWARRLLKKIKAKGNDLVQKVSDKIGRPRSR